jgi:hypothetical protein
MDAHDMNTYGEKLVRSGFNPSENPHVAELKKLAAEFIDKSRAIVDRASAVTSEDPDRMPQISRWVSLAVTHMETAAMFSTKACTA